VECPRDSDQRTTWKFRQARADPASTSWLRPERIVMAGLDPALQEFFSPQASFQPLVLGQHLHARRCGLLHFERRPGPSDHIPSFSIPSPDALAPNRVAGLRLSRVIFSIAPEEPRRAGDRRVAFGFSASMMGLLWSPPRRCPRWNGSRQHSAYAAITVSPMLARASLSRCVSLRPWRPDAAS